MHSDSTLGSKAWNSSRDDPTLLGYVARHCGKQSQVIVTHTGSLNFPNCPLVDKVIWNNCKSNHDRGQHAPLGGGAWKRSRSYDSRHVRSAGWQAGLGHGFIQQQQCASTVSTASAAVVMP